MDTIFWICAVVGGTLLVCQFLLSFLGIGEHQDVDGHDVHAGVGHDVSHHDAEHEQSESWFFSVLTFRTVVAAVTVFGLAGLAASAGQVEQPIRLVIALAGGGGAMFMVAGLMRLMMRLKSDGTVRVERAVGKTGTVYLTIPGQKAGAGKVTLNLQNRTVEYQAVTSDQELPTGAKVVVVAVVCSDTVEVAAAQA